MSTLIKRAAAVVLCAAWAIAQESTVDLKSGLKLNLPKDSPLTVTALDLGDSKGTVRGGAVVLDMHASLRLRNGSGKRVKGVTLLVLAQEASPGGKGSVAVPALDVAPGDEFPVRLDLRMVRPNAGGGPLVQVSLDGVLFDDLTFFGDNRLNSRRSLTLWELEARRDRKHFVQVLESRGEEGLTKEILAAKGRQAERPRVDVQVVRRGTMPRAANAPATNVEMDRDMQFSFLRMPGAPVDLMAGAARVAGDEAKAPHMEIRNRDSKSIRHLEIGLALKDAQGREFLAGTVPYTETLAAKGTALLKEESTLRVRPSAGGRVMIESMAGFVTNVEYSDSSYWIPSRGDLNDPRLGRLVPPSPEEQRLVQLYNRKGLQALIAELRR
ncbi:MAG: hypothetical protein FJW30_22230 [Acidobacteria bacterium]|nr:hypothetical protein [Acidobacteriota bacterium]